MRPRPARPTPGRIGDGSTPRRKRWLRDIVIPLLEQVDRLRVASGMSQKELAARVGLSQPTFSAILTGRRLNLRMQTMHEFLQAMGLDLYLSVRFHCPVAESDSGNFTLFSCYCGWAASGPAGIIRVGYGAVDMEPGSGRWRLWTVPGSEFATAVAEHVCSCRHGRLRYVIEWIGR